MALILFLNLDSAHQIIRQVRLTILLNLLVNPYDSSVPLPNGYSQASTVLNVDTAALAEAA